MITTSHTHHDYNELTIPRTRMHAVNKCRTCMRWARVQSTCMVWHKQHACTRGAAGTQWCAGPQAACQRPAELDARRGVRFQAASCRANSLMGDAAVRTAGQASKIAPPATRTFRVPARASWSPNGMFVVALDAAHALASCDTDKHTPSHAALQGLQQC